MAVGHQPVDHPEDAAEVGVLLDTLLVRSVLVPALPLRLGDTFWWPRRVSPERSQASLGATSSAQGPAR